MITVTTGSRCVSGTRRIYHRASGRRSFGGLVRDRLGAFLADWLGRLEAAIGDAQREGALDSSEDVGQLAFEIEAALLLANSQFIVSRTSVPIERARRAIERRLEDAVPG